MKMERQGKSRGKMRLCNETVGIKVENEGKAYLVLGVT
jgi:hypothetical protein